METREKTAFSDRWGVLSVLLMVFSLGGVFGFIYEELFYLIDLGHLVKRGITFGPWIPIYGFGAVLIVLVTARLYRHPTAVFVVSAIICGVLEFFTGYFLWHIWQVRLWDYNTEIWNWGNIGGYICIRSVLFFGVSALLLQYVVYPLINKARKTFERKMFVLVATVPAVTFAMDIVISLVLRARYLFS